MKDFFSRVLFFVFVLLVLGGATGHAQILIHEILAASHATSPDPDYSQISDWIEIYNAGSSAIELSDYYLTDDFSEPLKWRFPAERLDSGDYIIVWADGLDTFGNAMHTNFKLDNQGEMLALVNSSGSVVDSVTFSKQLRDISFGRSAENVNQFVYFAEPTPGRANTAGLPSNDQAGAVDIDVESGFYSGSLTVTLTAPGTIHYTTDGSIPSRFSRRYTAPVALSQTTVLRARVFATDVLPGPVTSRTFFINENITLPVFSLTADPDHLWDDEIGIYVDENISKRKDWERPALIEFFETTGRPAFSREISIRLFGRTAINIPQKSLSIFLEDNLQYPLFENSGVDNFDSFLLRSSSDDWHLTLFRDGFIQEVVQANLTVDTQDYRPAVLFINGEYWGIHNIREKYNESYIATHHNVDPDNIDMLYIDEREAEITVLAGDRAHYDAMIEFAENNDLSDPAHYAIISGMVDINNLIDYAIAEIYIGNRSWEWNIRAWRPRTTDGKWQWLIFDLDRGFRYRDENIMQNSEMMGRFHPFAELLENDSFKNLFIERLINYSNDIFQAENLIPLLDSLQATIAAEIPRHSDRWRDACGNGVCGINSLDDWNSAVDDMRSIVRQRQAVVLDQLADYFRLDSMVDLSIRVQEPGYGIVRIGDHTIITDTFNGHYFADTVLNLVAQPNDGFQFEGWQQTSSSQKTLVPRGAVWSYFDLGYQPADNWMDRDFDDSSWSAGPAELGYGDNDENTIVGYGGDAGNKFVTTYFRTSFSIDGSPDADQLELRLKRDDGAVVYLNGEEIIRSNMPAGDIQYDTFASESAGDEDAFVNYTVDPTTLISGQNTLAVEVHQRSSSSSDLSFDLELEAVYTSGSGGFVSSDPHLQLSLTDHQSLVAVFSINSTNELPSHITSNRTLTAANSPYLVLKDVIVQSGVTLTCEKGSEILLASDASLIINGQLIARGTPDAPVVLRGLGDSRWGAICFEGATGPSELSHVIINGATTGPDAARYKAAVSMWSSDVTLDFVTIKNVNQPLYANGGDIILINSVLDGTGSGDDIANIQYATARVENSHLFGNGELDFDIVHNGIIRNNRIDIISTNSNRDGIDIGASDNVIIENNQIFNCPDKGISIGEGSKNAIIRRNLVVNAAMGVAVKDDSYAMIDHNTFYNADAGIACYEKTAGQGGGFAMVTNSIFAGVFSDEFSVDATSSAQMSYSFSEKNIVDGFGNQTGRAHFVDPARDNFYLSSLSPCIDTADPDFTLDADGSRSDIGAFFFNQGPINTDGLVINEFMADNTQTLADENGEFDDWIELYNGGNSAIDVAGLYLSDDANMTTLWRIADWAPDSTTIAPGGFLLLWADEDSLQGVRHAGFKLNAESENIVLVKANKDRSAIKVIDSIVYATQQPDVSYGRAQDGSSEWRHFTLATPGRSNTATGSATSQNALPTRFVVHPNYPNPFNPLTSITYELPKTSFVTVEIFNALGQRVRVLVDEEQEPGVFTIRWAGVNDMGQGVSSGLYFFKVTAGEFSAINKMMLLQ